MTIGNLPAESNVFVGRERDLADLDGILDRARMLTLCGPGGIGKTRLAIRLGSRLAGRYPDGVWIADLAETESPDQLTALVCASLGVHAEPDRPLADTLAEALRPRVMLLILDTCEHLVARTASLTDWLLGQCHRLQVIATSTEPLRVRGEVIWRVPPLGLPSAGNGALDNGGAISQAESSDAVRLFVARAAAARPGFELTQANVAVVAEICATIDGVPLAIELAAARLRTLSAEQIRRRLADRFELLAVGDRTAPRRQQTLRATVEWSYELLSEPERLLLSRLAVFHGWSLEMAEQICGDQQICSAKVLDLLTALIDKSLVTVDGELDADTRYRLLNTVRQFAAERADPADTDRMRRAHRGWVVALAESMVDSAVLREDVPWTERVRAYRRAMADFANFGLALDYCAEQDDAEQGLRLCNAMRIGWMVTGDLRGSAWLDRFLNSQSPVSPDVRSHALVVRAEVAFTQQDYQAVGGYASEALSLAKASPGGNRAGAERMLAIAALAAGRADDAMTHANAAVATATMAADSWERGVAYAVRAAILVVSGERAAAERAYLEALETLGENRGWAVANVRFGLGRLALAGADLTGASRYLTGALALYRDIGARVEMARCLAALTQIAVRRADLVTASEHVAECVELSLLTGRRPVIARALAALAAVMTAAGDAASAVRAASAARQVFHTLGAQNTPAMAELDIVVTEATASLGPDLVAAAIAEGRRLPPDQVARQATGWLRHRYARPDAGQPGARSAWPMSGAVKPATAAGALTERERQVAVLVARGLPNKEIGEQLAVTHATASRHIANIYRKLGFTSRAQLTAWVLSSGPVSPPVPDEPAARKPA
jgi:predicted ATPase/DNA-binding CsgD family transcriptional regulator